MASQKMNWDIREIETVLADHLTPGSKILKYDIKALTAPGDNYGSVMQSLVVTIQEPGTNSKILHLVAKRLPANEMLCQLFNIQETFKKELAMYLTVIPTLSQFEKKYTKNTKLNELFAKFYGGRINLKSQSNIVDQDAVIILENLKMLGYEIGDRLTGFNEEYVLRILEDLATFHAVPIAFKIKNPQEFQKIILPVIKDVIIADGFEESAKQKATEDIVDVLKKTKQCEPYLDKITNVISFNLNGHARKNHKITQFSTISHTDYWVNNTMILKNNEDVPIRNKIVDLQMPSYCSATRDLIFFLYSSVQPTVLYPNIDKYLQFYYDCFIKRLKDFNIDITLFSREEFTNELKENAVIELGHILIMFQPILTKRGTIDDMSNLNLESMFKTELSSDYGTRVIDCVLSFIDRKWI